MRHALSCDVQSAGASAATAGAPGRVMANSLLLALTATAVLWLPGAAKAQAAVSTTPQATTQATTQAQIYDLDPEHLAIGFLVEHIGYARVLGQLRQASGSYRFDETTLALTDLRIEVDTASVDTHHRKRDEHLRGSDFLDVRRYPKMVFTAAGAERQGERDFLVRGELELLGRRAPVTLTARWNKSAVYEIGNANRPWVMGVSARGSFRRSAFGMMYAVDNGWVGDEVELIIEFEAKRRQP